MIWVRWVHFFYNVFGRLSRAQYWLGCFYVALYSAFVVAAVFMISQLFPNISFYALAPFAALFAIGLLAAHNLTVRRLHDLNQTGLWALPLFAPFYGPLVLPLFGISFDDIIKNIQPILQGNVDILFEPNTLILLFIAVFGLCLFVLYIFSFAVELFLYKGSVETNRFGASPLLLDVLVPQTPKLEQAVHNFKPKLRVRMPDVRIPKVKIPTLKFKMKPHIALNIFDRLPSLHAKGKENDHADTDFEDTALASQNTYVEDEKNLTDYQAYSHNEMPEDETESFSEYETELSEEERLEIEERELERIEREQAKAYGQTNINQAKVD